MAAEFSAQENLFEHSTVPGNPWLAICYCLGLMRRAVFRAEPGKGFIRTTLAPVNDRRVSRFGLADVLMLLALILAGLAVARVLVAR